MSNRPATDRRSFALGAACALALAAGAFIMSGAQRAQREQKEVPPPTYFVTAAEGNGAQLWRLPADSERLEFVGQFTPVTRGGR